MDNPEPGKASITPEQLHAAIEKARLEEREKLRAQITNLGAEVEALKTGNAKLTTDLAAATSQNTSVSEELKTLKAGLKSEGGIDVEKAIQQAVQAAQERVSTALGSRITELESQLATETSTRQKITLEQVRTRLIEEAGGSKSLIPEMVTGNNEEELRASIEKSKDVFNRTVATVVPNRGSDNTDPNTSRSAANSFSVPPLPLPNTTPGGGDLSVPSVRTMPLSDYAKNRVQLKRAAAARYPKSVI